MLFTKIMCQPNLILFSGVHLVWPLMKPTSGVTGPGWSQLVAMLGQDMLELVQLFPPELSLPRVLILWVVLEEVPSTAHPSHQLPAFPALNHQELQLQT